MKKRSSKKNPASKKRRRRIFLICTVLLLGLIIWIAWSNTALMTEEVTVCIQDGRLPPSFSGFRIAHVSDLHNAVFGEDNSKLLKVISDGAPDIIVITGDLVDANHTDMDVALDFAKRAVDIAPTYYVTGNHEASLSSYDTFRQGLELFGVVLLDDQSVQLMQGEEKIILMGLSDPQFAGGSDLLGESTAALSTRLQKMCDEASPSDFCLLLAHRPELFDTYAACGIDLVLSGHAHGGQFRLPLIGGTVAPNQGLFPRYDAGLFTEGSTHMMVSRGLGNSIIPFRFNNRPEVVFVVLTEGEA